MKKKENYNGLVPIEVEVAFDSKVKIEFFMNPYRAIIGPEGTEAIVLTTELVKAGYEVARKKGELIVNKDGVRLPSEARNGTAVLTK